jgi:hypothetical protein
MATVNDEGGVHFDLELKLFFAAAIFAFLKALSSFSTPLATNFAKTVFLLGHIFFILNCAKTQSAVSNSNASVEVKSRGLANLKAIFRSVLGRAAVIVLIHWRTGLLPPLCISVCLSICDALENPYFLDTLATKYPKFFGGLTSI